MERPLPAPWHGGPWLRSAPCYHPAMPDIADEPATDAIDALSAQLLAELRAAQASSLRHAWKLGSLLEQALAAHDDRYGRKLAAAVAQRLAAAGHALSTSTLYSYRQIARTYREDELPDLIERGISQTHAQTLASLPSGVRQQLEQRLADSSQPPPPSRAFKRMADDLKAEHVRQASVDAALRSARARDDGENLTLIARAPGPTAADLDDAAPTRAGDVERTKAMAKGPREFSRPPIAILKAADGAAVKMMAQTRELVQILDEAPRVGFDGERAMKNFLEAAQSLKASLDSYAQVLPELRQRLDTAIRAQHIAG